MNLSFFNIGDKIAPNYEVVAVREHKQEYIYTLRDLKKRRKYVVKESSLLTNKDSANVSWYFGQW